MGAIKPGKGPIPVKLRRRIPRQAATRIVALSDRLSPGVGRSQHYTAGEPAVELGLQRIVAALQEIAVRRCVHAPLKTRPEGTSVATAASRRRIDVDAS